MLLSVESVNEKENASKWGLIHESIIRTLFTFSTIKRALRTVRPIHKYRLIVFKSPRIRYAFVDTHQGVVLSFKIYNFYRI